MVTRYDDPLPPVCGSGPRRETVSGYTLLIPLTLFSDSYESFCVTVGFTQYVILESEESSNLLIFGPKLP